MLTARASAGFTFAVSDRSGVPARTCPDYPSAHRGATMALRRCSIIGHFIYQFGVRIMVVGVRRHMPRRRSGHTTTVTIGAERFYLTANQRDDGILGEVFIHWGKHGTSAAGLTGSYAV